MGAGPSRDDYDAVVIGGGVIGCSVAADLGRRGSRVLLVERERKLLARASYGNQARIHRGYHYPRSFLTAVRSQVNFARFTRAYEDCVVDEFESFYAIASQFSKVTAAQFRIFCERIGAPLRPAPNGVRKLFDSSRIDAVFAADEYAFDAVRLADRLRTELAEAGVEVLTSTAGRSIDFREGRVRGVTLTGQEPTAVVTERVFNCTYAALNAVLAASGLARIPLKYELAEMPLVRLPPPFDRMAVTVMCGPFFSTVPFPPRNLHTLSHVRYTPHRWWREMDGASEEAALASLPLRSNFDRMRRDAARYIPLLRDCQYVDSLWETKAVLTTSEVDDSRPILFRQDHGVQGLYCVLGGKIDNVFDVIDELAAQPLSGRSA